MLRNEEKHEEELIQVETQPKKDSCKNNFVTLSVAFVIVNDFLLLPALGAFISYACATMKDPPGSSWDDVYCHCCDYSSCDHPCVVDHDYGDNSITGPSMWTIAWVLTEGLLFLPCLHLIFIGIFDFLRVLFMMPRSTMWKEGYGYGRAIGTHMAHRHFGGYYFATMLLRLVFIICACFFLHKYPTCNITCDSSYYPPKLDWDWNGRINMLRVVFGFYISCGVIHLTSRRIFVYFLLPLVEREVSSVTILRTYFVKKEEQFFTATLVRSSD